MDKQLIKKKFSRFAGRYDQYAFIQQVCGEILIKTINKKKAPRILEIGCGTGNYTQLLKNKFPQALIHPLDISPEMLVVAKKKFPAKTIDFIAADGEAWEYKEKYDLITSNATFQWFTDLEKTLIKYLQMLDYGGAIYFSLFGPKTFFEFSEVLALMGENFSPLTARQFLDKPEITRILRDNFFTFTVKEESFTMKFSQLEEFLKTMKYTGGINFASTNKSLTRKTIRRLEEIYRKKFGAIKATYQAFFCRCR
jgi:malonyl-CoA O-methyltransferase